MKHSFEAEGDAPATSREALSDLRADSGTRESDQDVSSESLKAFKQSPVDITNTEAACQPMTVVEFVARNREVFV